MGISTIKECRERLRHLLRKYAVSRKRVRLASGKISNFYIDARKITLHPEGAYLIGRIILDMLKKERVSAIGGPTMGADPIVSAVALVSHLNNSPLNAFIVRKNPKSHGLMRLIEGPGLKKNSQVVLVDDVATTGGSLIEAKEILDREGIKVKLALVIVDREEGAGHNLQNKGLRLLSIFKAKDI